jgi:hypothetical protein
MWKIIFVTAVMPNKVSRISSNQPMHQIDTSSDATWDPHEHLNQNQLQIKITTNLLNHTVQ